jgi:Outer membrane protein beta-barrel domain
MKSKILIMGLLVLTMKALPQENLVTISGGYSFANIEDAEDNGTGWRINGLYEFNPNGGIFAHGISVGYIHLTAIDGTGTLETTSKVNSFPLYYAPKVMFGNEKIKVFIKGALGTQIALLKREGLTEISDHDFGFYGGGGAGLMFFLKENIFINVEYELAWASNSWYKDGLMNTAMGGIGFKF